VFCNKGTALAGPIMPTKRVRALAPEGCFKPIAKNLGEHITIHDLLAEADSAMYREKSRANQAR
jgi:hypothetical protein